MWRPLVSIVLPVKNGERFLAESISSVLSQNYRSIELIIIDGQSNDRSAEIIRSFPEAKYVSQGGTGVNEAWNQGINEAQGEYVGFIGSDDVWVPEKIQKQISYFEDHPDILCCITMIKMFLEPDTTPPPSYRIETLDIAYPGYNLETLLVHRSIFEQIGGFLTRAPGPQDMDWWLRLIDSGETVAVVPEVLVHKRIHDLNLSYTDKPEHFYNNIFAAMRRSIQRKRKSGSATLGSNNPDEKI